MKYIHYIQAGIVYGLGGYISKESLKGKSLEELYALLEENKQKLERSKKQLALPNQTPKLKKRREAFVRFNENDIESISIEINTRLAEQADAKTRAELEAKNKALAEATAKRDAEHKAAESLKAQMLAEQFADHQEAQKVAEAKARAAEKSFLEAEKAREERVNAEAKVEAITNASSTSSPPSTPSNGNKINWTSKLNQQNTPNSQPRTVYPSYHQGLPAKKEWLTPKNMIIGGVLLLLGIYFVKKQ